MKKAVNWCSTLDDVSPEVGYRRWTLTTQMRLFKCFLGLACSKLGAETSERLATLLLKPSPSTYIKCFSSQMTLIEIALCFLEPFLKNVDKAVVLLHKMCIKSTLNHIKWPREFAIIFILSANPTLSKFKPLKVYVLVFNVS